MNKDLEKGNEAWNFKRILYVRPALFCVTKRNLKGQLITKSFC